MRKAKFIQALVVFVLCAGITGSTYAQHGGGNGPTNPVKLGSLTFNAGIGAGAYYEGDYYNSPFGFKAAIERGMWEAGPGVVTLGGEIGGSFSNGGYYSNYHSNTVVVAVRAAFHCGWDVPGLDTYGGVSAGLGFHHYSYNNNTDYSHSSVIPVPGIFVGASYFVTPTFGFNAEAGHDITEIQVGIVLKLN
ncbi:MAG: hypothetical protein Q8927_10170 [Bacteroidota bacterium]|nr:hypothetical protein [Bacteroidota bacterium]MDP4216557.1 hypothetical protein [Bacteroidota bacterium]MDP4245021.1 hypothetical protein [Bacteroidota bacterium]MDP4252856.1 hypothetical protein [Bacteroidota bacterium]MDP4259848.1 hypothetical protein [Bacteroidota bacterium]